MTTALTQGAFGFAAPKPHVWGSPDLATFDLILVNTSAGKDSEVTLWRVCWLASMAGVLDRVVAVHCDLGRVEWPGTRELAEVQARMMGVPLVVVSRTLGDLLEQVEKRRMWPDSANRYCTADQKRAQVEKVMTRHARDIRVSRRLDRPVRILNCLGLRAAESPARAVCTCCKGKRTKPNRAGKGWVPVSSCTLCSKTGKRNPFVLKEKTGRREVWEWLPIHDLSVDQVWDTIRFSGLPHHPAYDLGMPRLFCVFAPRAALILAGKHNPKLLAEYVRVEQAIGHRFQRDLAIADVARAVAAGEESGPITTWEM